MCQTPRRLMHYVPLSVNRIFRSCSRAGHFFSTVQHSCSSASPYRGRDCCHRRQLWWIDSIQHLTLDHFYWCPVVSSLCRTCAHYGTISDSAQRESQHWQGYQPIYISMITRSNVMVEIHKRVIQPGWVSKDLVSAPPDNQAVELFKFCEMQERLQATWISWLSWRLHSLQIDGTIERVLLQRFNVKAFPSIYHLTGSECREYVEPRTAIKVSSQQSFVWRITWRTS